MKIRKRSIVCLILLCVCAGILLCFSSSGIKAEDTLAADVQNFLITNGSTGGYANITEATLTKGTNADSGNTEYTASLTWKPSNDNDMYSHIVKQTTTNLLTNEPSTIPYAKLQPVTAYTSRVLNVYPHDKSLYSWFGDSVKDPNDSSKTLFTISSVSIDDFNGNPSKYLTYQTPAEVDAAKAAGYSDAQINGYKYEAIFFGAWDANYYKDLTDTSEKAVVAFGATGRGVLIGHDTANAGHQFFLKIGVAYLGLYDSATLNCPSGQFTGGTSSTVKLLDALGTGSPIIMSYPYKMTIGSSFTISASHTNKVYNPDVVDTWMKFVDPDVTETTVPENGTDYNNNFYLITGKEAYSNYAMIQTGHTNGEAKPQEKQILVNTLAYLAKFHNASRTETYKVNDNAAPDEPTVSLAGNYTDATKIPVTFSATDYGTSISYSIQQISEKYGYTQSDSTATATMTSGVREYIYTVDSTADTVPDVQTNASGAIVNTNVVAEGGSITVDGSTYTKTNQWLHVRAVDYSGNVSDTTSVQLRDFITPYLVTVSYQDNFGNTLKPDESSLVLKAYPFSATSDAVLTSDEEQYDYYETSIDGNISTNPAVSFPSVGDSHNIVFIYTLKYLTVNLRQVVVSPKSTLGVPGTGYYTLNNVTSSDTSAAPYSTTNAETVSYIQDTSSGYTAFQAVLSGLNNAYTIKDIVPQNYKLYGFSIGMTAESDTFSGLQTTGVPVLNADTSHQWWVTVYITPTTGDDELPYSQDSANAAMGTIDVS